jgi:hypothetical protein
MVCSSDRTRRDLAIAREPRREPFGGEPPGVWGSLDGHLPWETARREASRLAQTGSRPTSHRGGHWFDPSIVHQVRGYADLSIKITVGAIPLAAVSDLAVRARKTSMRSKAQLTTRPETALTRPFALKEAFLSRRRCPGARFWPVVIGCGCWPGPRSAGCGSDASSRVSAVAVCLAELVAEAGDEGVQAEVEGLVGAGVSGGGGGGRLGEAGGGVGVDAGGADRRGRAAAGKGRSPSRIIFPAPQDRRDPR